MKLFLKRLRAGLASLFTLSAAPALCPQFFSEERSKA
jgi:hypothetical protein